VIAIRTGYCRQKKIRFSLLPDFVIHRRRVSRLTQDQLRLNQETKKNIQLAIDDLLEGLPEEFYFPLSTARSYLFFSHLPPP
jgi:hypothetical protein